MTDGIDLIKNDYINGDFESHDFKGQKFDFILMGQVLESFHNPIKAIVKVKELLNKDGALMIVSPDAELIYQVGMFEFGNWDFKQRWLIFSERQIKKTLETLGFRIVLSRKDTEKRFVGWNQFHVIAQNAG